MNITQEEKHYMDELQKKLNQKHAERPRKVRFKISSAYSGRVLKQVFEDGQELESPDEEYPHSFLHDSFETTEQYFSPGDAHAQFYPAARLTAQRISVFREGTSYRLAGDPAFSGSLGADKNASNCIDFGKIIIYTSNLKIIRTPVINKEVSENPRASPRPRRAAERDLCSTAIEEYAIPQVKVHNTQDDDDALQCAQCKGMRCSPCALCHGGKFTMLANRFKESYRALRCPACDENGLQPCQTCSHDSDMVTFSPRS